MPLKRRENVRHATLLFCAEGDGCGKGEVRGGGEILKGCISKKVAKGKYGDQPHFSWGIYIRGVIILCVDLLVFVGTCYVLLKFVLHQVLGGTRINIDLFDGGDWIGVIKYSAWPLTTLIIVFLFRNHLMQILYEMPAFVRRSYYREGSKGCDGLIEDGSGHEAICEDMEGIKCATGESPNATNSVQLDEVMQKAKDFEGCVIEALKKEFSSMICQRNTAIIERSRYSFDFAFEAQGRIFGVEVKRNPNGFAWGRVVNRVDEIYGQFSDRVRQRFTFVVCMYSQSTASPQSYLQLRRLLSGKQYYWEIRWYNDRGDMLSVVKGGGGDGLR